MNAQQLIEFLKAKNYYVDIHGDDNVLTVKFPEKKMGKYLSAYELKYKILNKTIQITGENLKHTIKCPKYAMYLAVFYDIILRTQILEINDNLVDLAQINKIQFCSDSDLVKQDTLLKFFQDNIFNQILVFPRAEDLVTKAKELGIYEGYDALIKVMGKGIMYDKRLVKEIVDE